MIPTAGDLRAALSRHAAAVVEDESCPTEQTARTREDCVYTLCVMTGTLDITAALGRADALLEQHAAHAGRRVVRPQGARPVPLSQDAGAALVEIEMGSQTPVAAPQISGAA
nr:DUF5133 domain-containing protein [Streptomyces sp. SID8367]